MSTKPMKPLKKPNTQVKVDLRDAETIKCSDCSNYLFIVSHILKRLSAIVSPNGKKHLFQYKFIVVEIVVKLQRAC